jgi:hypothetical protein
MAHATAGTLRLRSIENPHFWQNRPEVGQHFHWLGGPKAHGRGYK